MSSFQQPMTNEEVAHTTLQLCHCTLAQHKILRSSSQGKATQKHKEEETKMSTVGSGMERGREKREVVHLYL